MYINNSPPPIKFHLPSLQISCNARLFLKHLPEVQKICRVGQVEYFRLDQKFSHNCSSIVANHSDFKLDFFKSRLFMMFGKFLHQ